MTKHHSPALYGPEFIFVKNMAGKIHVGTSGWSYKHWKGVFYPHKLASAKWLPYYADSFSTTEINASFYRLPSEETVLKWKNQVPDNFLFCPKMSRYLTHMKKLREPEEPLERFFSVYHHLEKKIGPVLLQLPPFLKFNYHVAEHLYQLLKKQYRQYQFVMEVRHDTWMREESLTLMTKYDVGLVISQSAEFFPYSEMITAKNIYVRFHGPKELYASSYSDKALKSFADKFQRWMKEGHQIWVYFNNDIHAHAARDAQRLMQLAGKK